MEALVEIWMDLSPDRSIIVSESMRIESVSSPPGGVVEVNGTGSPGEPFMMMSSSDLSTTRAMLNSYMGLLSVALKASLNR